MSDYKNPDKMSVVELRRVAKRAINVLRSSGAGGWDLQDAYARLRKELEVDQEPAKPEIPFDTFKNPICRGDPLLGNNCGHCEKCRWLAEHGRSR